MIYVYAIAEPDCVAPDEPGLAGSGVECLREGPVAAFFSRELPQLRANDERSLWEHEAVVESVMEHTAVLPMRFGTILADEDALRDVLASRCEEFSRALDVVRGRVELGVCALADLGEPAAPASGRDYLLGKLERRRAAARIADEIHPSFAELAGASTRAVLPADGLVFAGAYLVEREHVVEFERRASRVDARMREVEVVSTGPWPPYSFTEMGGDD